jgi:hypothetical protein
MNTTTTILRPDISPSAGALTRMTQSHGEPLLLSDWDQVLMIHFEVERQALAAEVPFPLDLHEGRAFVTLVAFTMRRMRPRRGGVLGRLLFSLIATHHFLNVRTYVKVNDEPGIHFLAEWLSNRLAVSLGPRTFSLPYRHGRINYQNGCRTGKLSGNVSCPKTNCAFAYTARVPGDAEFVPCERGSLDEWLMERYAAFNSANGRKRFFRVWHPPWPQCAAEVSLADDSLLLASWPWLGSGRLIGGNYSPGIRDVWLGRPRRCNLAARAD